MTKKPEVNDLDARARAVATKLNVASDQLTESLKHAEAALVGMGLGVWARALQRQDEDTGRYESLTFGKADGRWGLFFESGSDFDSFDSIYTPVLEASREDRQQAARLLPKLFEALVAAAEKEVDGVEKSRTIVDQVAAAAAKARR